MDYIILFFIILTNFIYSLYYSKLSRRFSEAQQSNIKSGGVNIPNQEQQFNLPNKLEQPKTKQPNEDNQFNSNKLNLQQKSLSSTYCSTSAKSKTTNSTTFSTTGNTMSNQNNFGNNRVTVVPGQRIRIRPGGRKNQLA